MRRAKLVRKIAITVCLCIFSVCCLLLGVACKDKNATKDPIKVELSLYAGESMTLKTTYESYLLDWTSTDEQILLVDNYGKVTALKEGTATVTATIGDQKIIYTVQILPQEIVDVEEVVQSNYLIRLNANKIDCLNGSSYTLEAIVYNDGVQVEKTVEWAVETVEPYKDVLTITSTGNMAYLQTVEVGIANIVASVEGYSASCQVISHSGDMQNLAMPTLTVINGEKVYWNTVENATAYEISLDSGITWSNVGLETELENFLAGPESCEILVKAIGDSLYYANSNSAKIVFRNKMNLYYDEEVLTLVPYSDDAVYTLYNDEVPVCENLETIDFTKDELVALCDARKLNLKVCVQGTDVESNAVSVAIPWDTLGFEYDYDKEYIFSTSQMDNVEVVSYAEVGIVKPANGGDYLIKGNANNAMPTITFDFGRVLPKGTALKFSLYIANTDTDRFGWFPIVVNGKNQSFGYAYWVNTGSWVAYWSANSWVLEKASSTLSICANLGEFYADDGKGPLNYSNVTIYIDEIFIVQEYDAFDFEESKQIRNVSTNGTASIVNVADEVASGALASAGGLGESILKVSGCSGEPTISFNFGKTYAAGTQIAFTVYVTNTNAANENGWFAFSYPGYESGIGDMGSVYWSNGTSSFNSYWMTFTVTLTQDTSVLQITAKTGIGWADSNINPANLVLYIDNVEVVQEYDVFDFEESKQIRNVSTNGTTEIVDVATEVASGVLADVDGLGNSILKVSACSGEPTISFNFGKTFTAGTKLSFTVYVANTNAANENGWFAFSYPGYESGIGDMGSVYWANGDTFNSYWVTYTVTLTQDTSVLQITAKTGAGWADSNITPANLIIYIDNVQVIAE